MKIFLINPPVIKLNEPLHDTPEYMHVGLAHLYSSLKKFTEFDIVFIDCKFLRKDSEWLLKKIKNERPDIVGFTAKTLEIDNVTGICRIIKQIYSCKIIIGGPHATGDYEYIIKDKNVDFVAVSEFETGFIQLVEALNKESDDLSCVDNLIWKKNKNIIKNKVVFSKSEHIVRIAWENLPVASKYYIMAIRGCPQRCIFCMRVLGNIVRFRDIKDVADEIEMIYRLNPQALIEFGDETFTISTKYITKLLYELKKRKIGIGKKGIIASTRIDRLNKPIIRNLKRIGFKRLIVGIESGDKKILEICKKDLDINKTFKMASYIRECCIELECNFIIGLPGESIISVIKTALTAARLRPDNISVSIACPYPGTELYEMCKKNEYGLNIISEDFKDFNNEIGNAMEHEYFSRRALEIAQLFVYVFSFIGSMRFKAFINFCKKYRKEAVSYLKNLFNMRRYL